MPVNNLTLRRFFWSQVLATLRANLKQRYRGSFAGMLWVLIGPALTYGVQCLVFQYILKIAVQNYFLFLLSGLLPWIFIVQSVEMGTNCLVQHGRFLKSFPIHPLVPLIALVIDCFLNIAILFFAAFIVAAWLGNFAWWKLPWLGLSLGLCLGAALSMTWFLATLQVFYRDVRFVITFALQILFFITPIFYPERFLEGSLRMLLWVNPFHYLILPLRDLTENASMGNFYLHLGQSFAVALAFGLLAFFYWRRKQNVVYFSI